MRKFRLSESNAMLASALQSVRTNGRRPEGKSNSGHRSKLKFFFMLALLLTAVVQGARADDGWSVWDGVSTTKPSGYYSKEEGPVLTISSAAELAYVMQNFKRGTSYEFVSPYNYAHVWKSCFEVNCYKLTVDIDMTAGTWIPIGTNYEDLEYYSGLYGGTIFDGDGHTLRIKKDDNSSNNYQGLIKIITKECSVRNLHLDGKISVGNARLVGGIAGENNGTISNCWVSTDVISDWTGAGYAKVGGVAGENNGTIEYCCVTSTVANYDDNVAGIAGDNDDGTIRHCAFYGSLHLGDDMDNDNIYAGESGTEEDCFDGFNENQYNTANSAGKTLFCKAIKYTYDINVNNVGPGTVMVSASGEDNVPGARMNQEVTVRVTSGTAAGIDVTNTNGGPYGVIGNATSGWKFNIHNDVIVTTYFWADWPTQGEGTAESPYLITSAEDWNRFAHNVCLGRTYSGKHVKLDADISVSNPAGTSTTNSFQGTFDGDSHTLTFNKSGWTANFVAPFRYVSGNATIKNLKTAGTIQTTQQFASGLISYICTAGSTVTVQNCASSMTLNSSLDYNSSNGGLIAAIAPNCTVTVSGCAFNGSFAGASSDNNGGIVSWVNDGTTLTITDCLFAPASISTELDGCNTWARGAGVSTLTNCYYTQTYGTAQGTEVIATNVAPLGLGSVVTDYGMLKVYATAMQATGKYYFDPANFTADGSEGNPYIIGSVDDWNGFAANVSNGTETYNGKYVQLTADITVTNTAGTSETNSFQGTFIGNGHTITADITYNDGQGAAPFRYINGATIRDLVVAGSVTSNKYHAAGLVGFSNGTGNVIQNCVVSANVSGSGYVGGLVGHANSSTITISGCAYSSKMTGGGTYTGAFIGWSENSGTRTVTDCLYVMADGQSTSNFDLVKNGTAESVTGCYKTTSAGSLGTMAMATDTEPATLGDATTDYGMVKAYENGIFCGGMYYTAPALAGSGTEETPYTIRSEFDWNSFVALVNGGNNFSTQYVELTTDIAVTQMVGTSDDNSFRGTFDGGGYTITANITNNSSQATALFSHINGATIKNLTVAGTISSNQYHAAAIVGASKGTCSIVNCTATATVNGNGYVGGLVGHATDSDISITGCTFSGLMTGGGTCTRVFIGWGDSGSRSVTNCLYVMADGQNTTNFDLVKDGGTLTLNNNYYIADANLTTTQGKRAYSITTGDGFGAENAGGTLGEYNNLTFYDATGFKYDDVLYAASSDAVSLTLSADRDGYTPTYAASNGTLSGTANPYTLTMPAEDVTISLTWGLAGLSGQGTEASPYLIGTSADWDTFAGFVNAGTVAGFKDEYVKLNENISVTTMAGSEANHMFRGTFNGDGHTLTVNYTTTEDVCGPFRYTYGATIKNLKTSGTITTSSQHAGGVVGRNSTRNTTLHNVSSDVAIVSNYSGEQELSGFHGGLMGYAINATFEGCAFIGTFSGTSTHHWGGLLGQKAATENTDASFVDCLFAPTALNIGRSASYSFAYRPYNAPSSSTVTVTNSFYTDVLQNAQGTALYAYSALPDGIGTEGTAYNVSGITAYEHGIKHGTEYYMAPPATLNLAANLAAGNYWTTFYCGNTGYKINDGENACAYTATYSVSGDVGTITLHQLGKVIPKGNAVIIVGEDNEVSMTPDNTSSAEYVVENKLHGVDVTTARTSILTAYSADALLMLSNKGGNFGFHDVAVTNIPARKAFLALEGTAAKARSFSMVFDGEQTGISAVQTDATDAARGIYTLDGRKLNAEPTTKGVYIVNGKKVIVK